MKQIKGFLKATIVILVVHFGTESTFCQNIGVNSSGTVANPSALLDLDASPNNDKGLLIPRLTTAERDAISSPANGLMIYNTDCNSFNYYNGSSWVPMNSIGGSAPATPGSITGGTSQCNGATGVTYSISAVNGATSYTWIVPSGASITAGQGTTSITVDFGSNSGNVCVTANNDCGVSDAACLSITINSAPSVPTANAGSGIATTSFSANWTTSTGATGYYLDVATDAGFTNFVTGYNNKSLGVVLSDNVAGLSCATNYYYRVRATNFCGTTTSSNTIMVTTLPCGKIIFVTSTTHNGNLGGLAGADAICAARATAAGLPGTFMSFLSDNTTGAASRLTQATIPYQLVTGTTVANNWSDLTDGTIAAPIDRDEFGALVPASNTFSNTAASGAGVCETTLGWVCNNWTTTGALGSTCFGSTTATNNLWSANGSASVSCSSLQRLYCIEQ